MQEALARRDQLSLPGRSVRLEPLGLAHAPALFEQVAPSVYTHSLDWPEDDSYEAFAAWVQDDIEAPNAIPFAVIDLASGKPIGVTSLLDVRPAHSALEIGGTWYGPAFQGTRVNPECKYLLLQYAFEELGARRVQLKTSSENLRSQRAIAKLGAVREGVLRNFQVRSNGRSRDTVMFSITDAEWPDVRRRLEARLA